MFIVFIVCTLFLCSCDVQNNTAQNRQINRPSVIDRYCSKIIDNGQNSVSHGLVSKGSLENGKLFPFRGRNFRYFDTTSYLLGRAFVNDKVRDIILDTYEYMAKSKPNRKFVIMECSNQFGGEIAPHRTHQNGLSIDFMMPKLKNNLPYEDLDNIGQKHYLLHFDENGIFSGDETVSLDFELVAEHILRLQNSAIDKGFEIKKVIIKTELKDKLFATKNGENLKKSGIYFVQKLTPIINHLHDDHYHIDFGVR